MVNQLNDLFSGKKPQNQDEDSDKKIIYMSNINSCGIDTPGDAQTIQNNLAREDYKGFSSNQTINSQEGRPKKVFDYQVVLEEEDHGGESDRFSPADFRHHEHADTDEIGMD